MTFDDFEYKYTTTQERMEKEMWEELRKVQDEYLDQFKFKEGDPIDYDGEYIGLFDSMEWSDNEVLLNYVSNEIDEYTYMDGINPDLHTLHKAA